MDVTTLQFTEFRMKRDLISPYPGSCKLLLECAINFDDSQKNTLRTASSVCFGKTTDLHAADSNIADFMMNDVSD